MALDSAFKLLYAPVPEGMHRVRTAHAASRRIPDDVAQALADQLKARIYQEGYEPVEGPKIFRETTSVDGGPPEYVVTAVAIIREIPPEKLVIQEKR